jgi:hypothetical protein
VEALEAGEQLRGGATARANHMPVVAALATIGVTGDARLAVVAAEDAICTRRRAFVEERRFGGLSDEVVPNLLDRHRLDLLRVAGCRVKS